jgi:hypothetical protein
MDNSRSLFGVKNCLSAAIFASMAMFSYGSTAQVLKSEVKESAPEKYVVKKGDTLWAISGVFLKKPWLWPAIWGMNKVSIKNPNLIYPGDIIFMSEKDGKITLRLGNSNLAVRDGETVYLSPSIREELGENGAVKALPRSAIAPFIDSPLVLDDLSLLNGPEIISGQEGRINLGTGSVAYIDDVGSPVGAKFAIYRPGSALIDPSTGSSLGFEINNLGTAKIVRAATESRPAKIQILGATKEVSVGDKLVAINKSESSSYIPHAPDLEIKGRIVAIHGNLNDSASKTRIGGYETEGGPLSVIILNKGSADGVEEGHTFALLNSSQEIRPRNSLGYRNGQKVKSAVTILPEEENGIAMVFRTFDKVSYAIVLSGEMPVRAGDQFVQP